MQDLSNVRWNKSSRSGAGNTGVEVADLDTGGHVVRDSKNPAAEWVAFTAGVRAGEFG